MQMKSQGCRSNLIREWITYLMPGIWWGNRTRLHRLHHHGSSLCRSLPSPNLFRNCITCITYLETPLFNDNLLMLASSSPSTSNTLLFCQPVAIVQWIKPSCFSWHCYFSFSCTFKHFLLIAKHVKIEDKYTLKYLDIFRWYPFLTSS